MQPDARPSAPADAVTFMRPRLPGLELIRARATRQSRPKQRHDSYQFVLMERGLRRFSCRGGSFLAGAGDLVLIQSGEAHGSETLGETGVCARVLCVAPDHFARLAEDSAKPYLAA